MGISWTLRKWLSNGNSAITPDDWVMNLDIRRYHIPDNQSAVEHRKYLERRYALEDLLQENWSWVALESLYQLDQIDRMLATIPSPTTTQCHLDRSGEICFRSDANRLQDSCLRRNDEQGSEDNNRVFHWIDVGCKNFAMLPALLAAGNLLADSNNVHVTGIELDPYRRYLDGKTRGDYARGITNHYPNATYIEDDMLNVAPQFSGKAQVVSCFLPFVQASEHRAWGLGKQQFQPEPFFAALVEMLAPGGILLLSNLSTHEARITGELLAPYLVGMGEIVDTPTPSPLPNGGGVKPVLEGAPPLLLHCEGEAYTPHFMQMQEPMRYLWTLQKRS